MRLWRWFRRNTVCRLGGHHWDLGGMTAFRCRDCGAEGR